jgi:hypothetical protein
MSGSRENATEELRMKWKKGLWLILRYYPSSFFEGLRKTIKNPVRMVSLQESFKSGALQIQSTGVFHYT